MKMSTFRLIKYVSTKMFTFHVEKNQLITILILQYNNLQRPNYLYTLNKIELNMEL